MAMTPRQRVEAVLRGERPDRVPFTVYEDKLPQCEGERRLREEGLCIVARSPSVYRVESPHVAEERVSYSEKGVPYLRTNVKTPEGDLYSVERLAPDAGTTWYAERLFKGPGDYRALEFMVRDQEYSPNYDAFSEAQEAMGDDGFLLADIGYSPLQETMYTLMGLEAFAIEWAERRDEVLRLYSALVENRRRLYPIAAASPALAVNYDGNVSAEVVGLERFRDYYVPHYDEFAEIMHAGGKVTGGHFDAHTWALADAIGESEMDYVEALTPRPDGDMDVAEAHTAWPDKVLWVNFPASIHAQEAGAVEEAVRQILWEAAPGDRLMLGVTADVPLDSWQESFGAILRVINREAKLPIHWKSPRLEGHREVLE